MTVKELCTTDITKDEMGNFPESMYELSLLFDKRLKNILQAHEKEVKGLLDSNLETIAQEFYQKQIAEKDKEIKQLKYAIEGLGSIKLPIFNKNQLFKEDFELKFIDYGREDGLIDEKWILKDDSKYEQLESKGDK